MLTDILGVIAMFLLTVAIGLPLGKYIAKVYKGERTWLDFMAPLERFFFRVSGIDASREMTWKQSMVALLSINLVWFFWAMFLLMTQSHHPFWNPDNNPSMSPDLAFNTAISFLVNCNLQHYSGETGLSYLSQRGHVLFAVRDGRHRYGCLRRGVQCHAQPQHRVPGQLLRLLPEKLYPHSAAFKCGGSGDSCHTGYTDDV
ncbi:hypothetical protein GCM10028895_22690 [Pontibacter rugosus]